MSQIEIDLEMCDRFIVALQSCYANRSGEFDKDIALQKLKKLSRNDLVLIEQHKKEPSKELLLEALDQCDTFATEWLLAGKINIPLCERILHYISKNKLNPTEIALNTGVSNTFFSAMHNHKISPSERFVIRFCATYSISIDHFLDKKK